MTDFLTELIQILSELVGEFGSGGELSRIIVMFVLSMWGVLAFRGGSVIASVVAFAVAFVVLLIDL